ncbi:crotonase/enoyl-CoA hydratase family protein [Rhodovulum sp. DZ06]|uniref:crotonase/enoyl-CoA hydratase family protein n=1 Tax=Rhodovulum sp. DZ06 TaxID=3425126 RepID=UPI003D332C89
MSEALTLTTIENGIAEIRLNRADKMNAITTELIEAMAEAAAAVAADPSVRVVILSGEGRAFCAGLDKGNFSKMVQGGPDSVGGGDIMDRTHGASNLFQHAGMMWRDLPVPVIAALHGVCLGGGLQIALGADIRIAAPGTKLSVMEMKWGLVPDMSGMVTLRHLVRGDVLRRLVYTAEVLEAEAAQQLGLVTEVAEDPLARARALAADIAGRSPSAMRSAKALLNIAEGDATEDEVLLAESRLQKDLIGAPDQIETVMAQLQGRPAKYA